jgi:hypothetical protein
MDDGDHAKALDAVAGHLGIPVVNLPDRPTCQGELRSRS